MPNRMLILIHFVKHCFHLHSATCTPPIISCRISLFLSSLSTSSHKIKHSSTRHALTVHITVYSYTQHATLHHFLVNSCWWGFYTDTMQALLQFALTSTCEWSFYKPISIRYTLQIHIPPTCCMTLDSSIILNCSSTYYITITLYVTMQTGLWIV